MKNFRERITGNGKRRTFQRWMSTGVALAMILGMTACGSSNGSATVPNAMQKNADSYSVAMATSESATGYGYGGDEFYPEEAYDGEASRMQDGSTPGPEYTNSNIPSDRKLIRYVSLNVETKEFDAFLVSTQEQIKSLGGYIESMNTYNGSRYSQGTTSRYSSLTVRIPKQHTDSFLDAVSEAGNVTNRSENVEDVTLEYVDMESHKKSLQTEQERLQALLEKAETLEDIITLEDRLSTVRYQLERMESQLRTYDNKVDYSTINMSIQEVKELTPVVEEEETPGQRLVNGFMESLEDVRDGLVDFFIWFVIHIPYLLVWIVVIAIIVLVIKAIIRHCKKKSKAAREKKMNQHPGNGAWNGPANGPVSGPANDPVNGPVNGVPQNTPQNKR